jgi:hypothetical protein
VGRVLHFPAHDRSGLAHLVRSLAPPARRTPVPRPRQGAAAAWTPCAGNGGTWPSGGPRAPPRSHTLATRASASPAPFHFLPPRQQQQSTRTRSLPPPPARARWSWPFRPPPLTADSSISLRAPSPPRTSRARLGSPW